MPSLPELLRARRTEILDGWERAATRDAEMPAAKRSGPVLRAHLPQLLDAMIEGLEGRWDMGALLPDGHAKARLEEGYSIAAVLHELSHLREQIVSVVEAAQKADGVDVRGIRDVHVALDECMVQAAVDMERVMSSDRERFVAVLGHDLRTPLNAVKMAGSLLFARERGNDETSLAQKIVRAADRMNRMIADLLDFAALRSGGLTLEKRTCDLGAVCAEVIDELRLARADRDIAFDVDGDCTGVWDEARMAQVVSNLVSNAITYSPESSRVGVRLACANDDVVVEVHNEGDPIPTQEQPNVFAPFKRNPKRKGGGIGLGLFIAHEMVRAHGGDIGFTSDRGNGTTFTVRVPRAS